MVLADIISKIRGLEKGVAERKVAREIVTRVPVRAVSMKPRPYQAEDIEWLRDTKRGILGWAPGLGKTFGAAEAAVTPAVVSCPLALVEQWREFLEEQYPMDKVSVAAYGNAIKRDAAIKEDWDWLIVNHDAWRTYYMGDRTVTLVIDEMHHFRNREAARSKRLFAYAKNIDRVYGLTATPIFKDMGDLWHLLHILNPTEWSSYWRFVNTYALTSSDRFSTKIVRIKDKRQLDAAIKPYIRERTYKQVGMYLPERVDKHVVLKLTPGMRKVYDRLRDHFRLEMEGLDEIVRYANAGAVLHALRQLTLDDNKLDAIKELVEDTPGDEPIIVFTWYRESAEKVANALDGVCVHGDVKPADRRVLMRTGGPERKRVRVATMESVSEGIDLSEARTVIYAEETYVPGQQYQSMTRVIRYSREANPAPVIVHWVRYEQTVDDIVHRTARSRTQGNALTVLQEALM